MYEKKGELKDQKRAFNTHTHARVDNSVQTCAQFVFKF